MAGSVKNGRRVKVSLPDFEGLAGYQDALEGPDQLSYAPNLGGEPLSAGQFLALEDRPREIIKRERSAFVSGMVTLFLKPLEG